MNISNKFKDLLIKLNKLKISLIRLFILNKYNVSSNKKKLMIR